MLYIENYFQHDRHLFSKDKVIWLVSVDEKIVLRLGLTIAAKFTITIVIDSQKHYHDRLSLVDFTIAILSR